jgi:hypothetical protein
MDPAAIFSLGFNPSGTMLACTSDKSTLHIFDIPHPTRLPKSPTSPTAAQSGGFNSTSAGNPDNSDSKGKWGILGKIPLMPRIFSDIYSFTNAPFETGEEPVAADTPLSQSAMLATSRPPKGVIGWVSDNSLLVIGGGKDARWEKFNIEEQDGQRVCRREGWRRYLHPV